MKKVRTIIIDGIEIQTSLSAVEIADLVQKNQELKKQLEESDFKIANLTMDKIELKKQLEDLQETHYLIQGGRSNGKTYLMKLQADKEQLNSLVNSCQEEIRRLKKQNEEHKIQYFKDTGILSDKILELKNQQKEFMEYLGKIIVDSKAGSGQQYYAQEHLKMFKEIIGKDINVTTKGDKDDK